MSDVQTDRPPSARPGPRLLARRSGGIGRLLRPCARPATCTPAGSPPGDRLEERLRRVEEVNARLLEQLNRDREESARRYGQLEDRYRRDREESARRYGELEDRSRELQRRLGDPCRRRG